jgi:hypothetical protein
MIKINLLPPEAGKRPLTAKKSTAPSAAPYFAVLAIIYALALYGAYWAYAKGQDEIKRLAARNTELNKKKAEVKRREKEFEENNLLSQEIEEKYAVVQALGPENRIFWSEKLNMISKARMNLAVYVTKLKLTEVVTELETPESAKRRADWRADQSKTKGPEPKAVKQPIINQTLQLDAIAYGADSSQRLRQVNAFYDNLLNLKWKRKNGAEAKFVDRLKPQFGQLDQRMDKVGGVDVLRFAFAIAADPQLTTLTAPRSAADALLGTTTGTATAKPGATPVAAPAGGAAK